MAARVLGQPGAIRSHPLILFWSAHRFILSQIFGAYVATGLVYVQYRHLILVSAEPIKTYSIISEPYFQQVEAGLKLKQVYGL